MKTIIFSDSHLSAAAAAGRARMAAVCRFLRGLDPREVGRLIILGDLFDFWFEYRHVIFSCYFDVLRALAALRDGNVEIHFVRGNHDLWAGRFLSEDLGFHIHDGPVLLPFGGEQALLIHGDGLNPADRGYRVYKRIARNPFVIACFRLLHPDWAMALGRWVSGGSRHFFSAKDVSNGPETRSLHAYARRVLAEGKAGVVLCGHCHYPCRAEYPTPTGTGLYLNTGDWLHHQSYVEWEAGEFRLCSFEGTADDDARRESQGAQR